MNKLHEFLLSLVIFLVIVIVLCSLFINGYIGIFSFLFGYICVVFYLTINVFDY